MPSSKSPKGVSSKKRKERDTPRDEGDDEEDKKKEKKRKILVLAPSQNIYKQPSKINEGNAINTVFSGIFNVNPKNSGHTARELLGTVPATTAAEKQRSINQTICSLTGCSLVNPPPYAKNISLFKKEENHDAPSNGLVGWALPYTQAMTKKYVNKGIKMVSTTYRHPNQSFGDTMPFSDAHILRFPGIWASCGVPISEKTQITDIKLDIDGNAISFKISHFLPEPVSEDKADFNSFKAKLNRARQILIEKVDNAIATEAAGLQRKGSKLLDFLKSTRAQFIADQSVFGLEEHARAFIGDPDILKILKIVCEKTLERLRPFVHDDDLTFIEIEKCVRNNGYIPRRVKLQGKELYKTPITLYISENKGINCLASASSMYSDLGPESKVVRATSAIFNNRDPEVRGVFASGKEPEGFEIEDTYPSKPMIIPPTTLHINIDNDENFLAMAYEMAFNTTKISERDRILEKELKTMIFSNDNPFLSKVSKPNQIIRTGNLPGERVSSLRDFAQASHGLSKLRYNQEHINSNSNSNSNSMYEPNESPPSNSIFGFANSSGPPIYVGPRPPPRKFRLPPKQSSIIPPTDYSKIKPTDFTKFKKPPYWGGNKRSKRTRKNKK
jgi:hypothetical protein